MRETLVNEILLPLLLKSEILKFGSFKTKSGRISPYFFNTGNISTGETLSGLASCFATELIKKFGGDFNNLYGPAYKGIPLAAATCTELYRAHRRNISYTFNRKEAKVHGEGGIFVGDTYSSEKLARTVIIEDVLTAGTSLRESIALLQKQSVEIVGALVAIDRQEQGQQKGLSARTEIERDFNMPVYAMINLDDIIETLHNKPFHGRIWINDQILAEISSYRSTYGS